MKEATGELARLARSSNFWLDKIILSFTCENKWGKTETQKVLGHESSQSRGLRRGKRGACKGLKL